MCSPLLCRTAFPVWQLPVCAPPQPDAQRQASNGIDAQLRAWLRESEAQFAELAVQLRAWHEERVRKLEAAAGAARATLWWPFTQHTSVRRGGTQIIKWCVTSSSYHITHTGCWRQSWLCKLRASNPQPDAADPPPCISDDSSRQDGTHSTRR